MITQCHHPVDLVFKGKYDISNPFYADVKAYFQSPKQQELIIPAFYNGNDSWVVRFAPNGIGKWNYRIESDDVCFEKTNGVIECTANDNENIHGSLKIDPLFSDHFIHDDGTHHFMLPYECDWLWSLYFSSGGMQKIQDLIAKIKNHGFNGILMNVYAHDTNWSAGHTSAYDYGPPELFIWEGTNEEPNHDKFNIDFFRGYDEVVNYLFEQGMIIHLYFKVYNKKVNWPSKGSKQDNLFFKYIVSRYQAYSNIVWDFSKESYLEPDKEYIRSCFRLISECDGYNRLKTLHDDPKYYYDYESDAPLDFFTAQQFYDFYYHIVAHKLMVKRPILNAEFAYEHGPGGAGDITYPRSNKPEEIIKRTYQIVIAGGYPAYYYTNTAWDVINYEYEPVGYKYMKILYEFFTSIEWWKFVRYEQACCWKNTRCLAITGQEYIVLIDGSLRKTMLNFAGVCGELDGVWMNIYTGEKKKAEITYSDCYIVTQTPFDIDCSLLYIRVEPRAEIQQGQDNGKRFLEDAHLG